MTTPDPLQRRNRKDELYHIQQGKTPGGRPRYYAARKLTGKPLTALPDGYEIHEKPENGQVLVRRVRPSLITELERKQAEEIVHRVSGHQYFVVAVEPAALAVYTPVFGPSAADRLITEHAEPILSENSPAVLRAREGWIRNSRFYKMMRFELLDPGKRSFRALRWCAPRSAEWIVLRRTGALAELVEEYAKHLDRESWHKLF